MSANSKIEWTDHTFNPWIGCTKVSPGCAHCYAETLDRNRYSKTLGAGTKATPVSHWGPGAPRHRTKTWGEPVKWNAQPWICEQCGEGWALPGMHPGTCEDATFHRARVFSASLADWLDEEVPIEWLADFLALIHATPRLDWLLLTKRPENWRTRIGQALMCASSSRDGKRFAIAFIKWLQDWVLGDFSAVQRPPANVWIGTTVEDQTRADVRIPALLQIPARVRFLSCEPLLGAVEFSDVTHRSDCVSVLGKSALDGIHWVICGGESGLGKGSETPRPMHPDWARSLRDQCAAAGVPFFFKQWGQWLPVDTPWTEDSPLRLGKDEQWLNFDGGQGFHGDRVWRMRRVGKKAAGALLDGVEHSAFPEPLSSERKAVAA